MSQRQRSHNDYMVGIICPLAIELTAALCMLDKEHAQLPQSPKDHNAYTLGEINGHNVVLAGLHEAHNNYAATVVAYMQMTFPNIRFGLLVGIGGGVPHCSDAGQVRLGHIVVSQPTGSHSGAVQYDCGKAETGQFQRTGAIPPPPATLLNAANRMAARRARMRHDPLKGHLRMIDTKIRGLKRHERPKVDRVFRPDYSHCGDAGQCKACCDIGQLHIFEAESEDWLTVHRGTIATGGLVLKNARLRDQLAEYDHILCFETEAAGALNDFPCLVIRGISDYADSHKNDEWQSYAAAVAAAYARELCHFLPTNHTEPRSLVDSGHHEHRGHPFTWRHLDRGLIDRLLQLSIALLLLCTVAELQLSTRSTSRPATSTPNIVESNCPQRLAAIEDDHELVDVNSDNPWGNTTFTYTSRQFPGPDAHYDSLLGHFHNSITHLSWL